MDIFPPPSRIWSFYAGGDSNAQLVKNFKLGIQNGVWGSVHDGAFTERESIVQLGDFIFFTCGYKRKKEGPNQNRYKTVESLVKYFEQFNRLVFARVTSNVYRSDSPIWKDGIYPVRFSFEVINRYENVPISTLVDSFSEKNLDVFRLSMIPPVKARRFIEKQIEFEKLGITYFQNEFTARVTSDLAAIEFETEYWEGTIQERFTNYYERNPGLRVRAIEIHGTTCMACGFSFEASYLERGKDFIEVHHTIPVSELGESTKVDPGDDLVVLCSNCHRMVHRVKDDILSLTDLVNIIKRVGRSNR